MSSSEKFLQHVEMSKEICKTKKGQNPFFPPFIPIKQVNSLNMAGHEHASIRQNNLREIFGDL